MGWMKTMVCWLPICMLLLAVTPVIAASDTTPPALTPRSVLSGTTISQGEVSVTAVAGGGLQVQRDRETYFIESAYSYPKDGGAGWNAWRALPRAAGESGWTATVRRIDPQTLEISSNGRGYQITRRVRFANDRVEIADTIRNSGADVTGIRIRYEMLTPGLPTAYRLHGLTQASVLERQYPENPTGLLVQTRTALGGLIEDSALRLQMASELTGNMLRMHFNHFGIAPGASHTIRWALYPFQRDTTNNATADYFRFVNTVREDWRVNFTVPGPLEFVSALTLQGDDAEAKVQALIARENTRIFALSPWFEYYAVDMDRERFRTIMQKAIAVIKRVRPDAICLANIEANLAPIPLSFFGNAIPKDLPYGRPGRSYGTGVEPGQYNLPAPPAMARVLEDSPWNDSLLRNRNGQIVLDTWNVDAYRGGWLHLKVYPVVGNNWHAQMLDKIRYVFDEVGFDGIYFDQYSYAYSASNDRFTFERWDGVTVDIDANGRVIRRYADLGLLTSPARIAWANAVLQRGKMVVANGLPAVTEEQALRIYRFTETQPYNPLQEGKPVIPKAVKAQLSTPIGMGHRFTPEAQASGARFYNRTVIAQLGYGLLYYNYVPLFPPDGATGGGFGVVNHMFPMTPVQLGEGFIIGKERIVTAVSRTFDWPGNQTPTIRIFDERGLPLPNAERVTITPTNGGHRVTIRLRDWWQTAVIE